MSNACITRSGLALSAAAAAVFAIGAVPSFANDRDDDRDHRGISQSGEQKDMRRVGHSDLQGRPTYHPTFIKYPDGRVIAFANGLINDGFLTGERSLPGSNVPTR